MKPIKALKQNIKSNFKIDNISARVLSCDDKLNFHQDIARITVWRNFYPDAYLTSFYSTFNRTLQWATNVYMKSNSDIMLMLEDDRGVCFGHIAFHRFIEDKGRSVCDLTRVIRAPGLGSSQCLLTALEQSFTWCHQFLDVEEVRLQVFNDNKKAISLYKRLGFKTGKLTNVEQITLTDKKEWKDTCSSVSERQLMSMSKLVSLDSDT